MREILELGLEISFFLCLWFHCDYHELRLQDLEGLKKLLCMVSLFVFAV